MDDEDMQRAPSGVPNALTKRLGEKEENRKNSSARCIVGVQGNPTKSYEQL